MLSFSRTLANQVLEKTIVSASLYVLVVAVITTFLVYDTWDNPKRLVGAGGFLALILIGWIFSVYPGKVRSMEYKTQNLHMFFNLFSRWRHIIWGHSIQFVFALIALRFVHKNNFEFESPPYEGGLFQILSFVSFSDGILETKL